MTTDVCASMMTSLPAIYTSISSGDGHLPLFQLKQKETQSWVNEQLAKGIGPKANAMLRNAHNNIQSSITSINKLSNQNSGDVTSDSTSVQACSTDTPTAFRCNANMCTYQSGKPWELSRSVTVVLLSPRVTRLE
jgi:hypothetical protein